MNHNSRKPGVARVLAALCLVTTLCALPALAITDPDMTYDKEFVHPDFFIPNSPLRLDQLDAVLAAQVGPALSALGADAGSSRYDLRAGMWSDLVMATPLVPGPGFGNTLTWSDLGINEPQNDIEFRAAALDAFKSYLAANQTALGVDPAELESYPAVSTFDNRRVVQIHAWREVDGVKSSDAWVQATINSGNLMLYGVRNWNPVDVSTTPTIAGADALAAAAAHMAPDAVSNVWRRPKTALRTMALGTEFETVSVGAGYTSRLVYEVGVQRANDVGAYLAVIDAHSGEVLALKDQNQHATRRVFGGVYPVSNDGIPQDGVEQPRFPMPFLALTASDAGASTTNSAGLATPEFDGAFSSNGLGLYVRVNDTCGGVNEQTTCQDMDFGFDPGQTDCHLPPGGHSAGDTHSTRTAIYELNRLLELWRSRLSPLDPAFGVVNGPTTQANMNINSSCNAFFTPAGMTINFYTSGASGTSVCRNTGEIAAVFDHEWGHFIDTLDGNGISASSEGYADIVGISRLNDPCVGRGFFFSNTNNGNCTGFGDLCTQCTGVRETDWKKHVGSGTLAVPNGLPHDVRWLTGVHPTVPGGCVGTGIPGVPTPNPPGLSGSPCGGSVHCNGHVQTESFVDLYTRDMRCGAAGWEDVPSGTFPVNGGRCVGNIAPALSLNTALEISTSIFLAAKGNIRQWFLCSDTIGGCGVDSGYMQFLAGDDDDGNLATGTPHGASIWAAFNRHQVACPGVGTGPPNAFIGCLASPTAAPASINATATVNGADVTWSAVPNAVAYRVYRTEGVRGCEFGKELVATFPTNAVPFSETGLLDGFEYRYAVQAIGASGACVGQMSNCAAVTPLAPPGAAGPQATVSPVESLSITTGDSDEFLDNCERATIGFSVANTGTLGLTNVRISSITPKAPHTSVEVHTAFPIPVDDLTVGCGSLTAEDSASFEITAHGMSHGETLEFDVTVMADQLTSPATGTLQVTGVESDLTPGSRSFTFEDGTLQGWTSAGGTWNLTNQTGGGAGLPPSNWYLTSSQTVDFACDVIRSPKIGLTATSTLSLQNQFITEPESPGTGGGAPSWYDRANVGLISENGQRWLVEPDTGRLYEADSNGPGNYEGCNEPEEGWATGAANPDAGGAWGASNWSTAALDAGLDGTGLAGRTVQIEVINATDSTASVRGLWFDSVVLENVLVPGADAQADDFCVSLGFCDPAPLFADGFESGDTSQWSNTRDFQGKLAVSEAAQLNGTFGMGVTVNANTTSWVVDNTPNSETKFCESFLFNTNNLVLPTNRGFSIAEAGDPPARAFLLGIRNKDGAIQVGLRARQDDGSSKSLPFFELPTGTASIGVEWSAATAPGANNGVIRLLIAGVEVSSRSDVDNDTLVINRSGIGLMNGWDAGTSGTVYFDLYESRH